MSCSFCYTRAFSGALGSELLVTKEVPGFLHGDSVSRGIKHVFLIFPEKVGWYLCGLECKEAFRAESACAAQALVHSLSGCFVTCRVGCGIPAGSAAQSSGSSAVWHWGALPRLSSTSWFWRSLQTGKWKRQQIVSLCPISRRRSFTFWSLTSRTDIETVNGLL